MHLTLAADLSLAESASRSPAAAAAAAAAALAGTKFSASVSSEIYRRL